MESSALIYILLVLITLLLAAFVDNRGYARAFASYPPASGRELPPGSCSVSDRQAFQNRVAGIAIFCLLTGVSACRIAVGNDYWVYRFNFRLIAQERHVASEGGFNLIVRGMQDLFGYDNYLPIFALFSLLTCLFFCLALRDQGEYYLFSLFLLMTGGYYFNSLNSVRYYLALAMALYAMGFVLRKRYASFCVIILLAANFHKSVLLVIPVYLLAWGIAHLRLRRWMAIPAGLLLASLIFCQNLYRELFFTFYPFYRNSEFDISSFSLTNLAKCVAVLLLCLLFCRRRLAEDVILRFYLILNFLGLIVYCCGGFLPETSRIGYYMIISQVFLLPRAIGSIEIPWQKKICLWGTVLAFTFYFAFLLKGMYAINIRLLPYLNWIFD